MENPSIAKHRFNEALEWSLELSGDWHGCRVYHTSQALFGHLVLHLLSPNYYCFEVLINQFSLCVCVCASAVYDLTIGYKERCPLFINNLYGTDPSEVHMHVRRIPVCDIPESEEDMSKWLFDLFHQKDQMLALFSKTGSFPDSGIGEKPLSVSKGIFTLLLHLIPSLWIWWWLYNSLWVKVYVSVVCLGLALSTYFSWRPSPFYTRLISKRKKL